MSMGLTETHLRYLLAIYDLARTVPDVGAAEIAKALAVSKPSVTRMLGVLMDRGLLVRERYGKVYLTDTGFLLAKGFKRKVEQLQARIPRMGLRLTEEELLDAACVLAAALPESALEAGETAGQPV